LLILYQKVPKLLNFDFEKIKTNPKIDPKLAQI